MTVISVLSTSTSALLDLCAQRGVAIDDVLEASGISREALQTPNARIPEDRKWAIWEAAKRRTGDAKIGLQAANIVPFGTYGVLDYLALSSSTLEESLTRASRYYHLINSGAELRLKTHKKRMWIELLKSVDTTEEQLGMSAEYTFALTLLRLQMAIGKPITPAEVHFTHPEPRSLAVHNQVFQAPLRFSQASNHLIFNQDLLRITLPRADEPLAESLEYHAQRLLRQLPEEDRIIEDVRQVLRAHLRNGDVSLVATARALAMSGRGLQRKLHSRGISYREVLDKLRRELALEYVAQQADAGEIAHLLGFSEPSTFYRAFKEWTGTNYKVFTRR